MRIVKNEAGEFEIIDEPLVITGEAADRLREEMDKPLTPEKRAFLEECERIYRNSNTGR
jgi:hypothetical protein